MKKERLKLQVGPRTGQRGTQHFAATLDGCDHIFSPSYGIRLVLTVKMYSPDIACLPPMSRLPRMSRSRLPSSLLLFLNNILFHVPVLKNVHLSSISTSRSDSVVSQYAKPLNQAPFRCWPDGIIIFSPLQKSPSLPALEFRAMPTQLQESVLLRMAQL
ncbi:hypothetical protein Mapa_001957 [Marchantia paleacea]|nr:hypothetical protein Mapa_001957 [Marchantia paleacea]